MDAFPNQIQKDMPMSPPGSTNENRSEAAGSSEMALEPPQADDLWRPLSEDAAMPGNDDPGLESYEFLCNASWGSQSQESSNPDFLYNDFFAPDTGKWIFLV